MAALATNRGDPRTVRRADYCCALVWLMLRMLHRLVRGWVECTGERAGVVACPTPKPEDHGAGGMTTTVDGLDSSGGWERRAQVWTWTQAWMEVEGAEQGGQSVLGMAGQRGRRWTQDGQARHGCRIRGRRRDRARGEAAGEAMAGPTEGKVWMATRPGGGAEFGVGGEDGARVEQPCLISFA